MGKSKRLRWVICFLLFLSTVINYIDRQALSVLARTIQDDLALSDLDYAHVVQAFMLAYTAAYLFAGRITDWLGCKKAMTLFIGWWSIANVLTGTARSVFTLGLYRFLLGLGEPGNYTVAPRAVAEWFPPKERGLAIGIYTAGATIGATIAPPLIAFLALQFNWRAAFYFTGAMGLIWIIPWLLVYRKPASAVHSECLALAGNTATHSQVGMPTRARNQPASPWKEVFADVNVWRLCLARFMTDPVWYFYLFWFPKYLTDARSLSLREVGAFGWIVYLAADVGSIVGGFLSGSLIARGVSAVDARLKVMFLMAAILPLTLVAPFVDSLAAAFTLASISAFAHLGWQVTLTALATDLFPQRILATAFGVVAAGSGLGGFISAWFVGYLVSNYSYSPVFLFMGVMHIAAYLLWLRPLALRGTEREI